MIIWIKDQPYEPVQDNKWQAIGTCETLYPNAVGFVITLVNITQRAFGGWG